MKRLSSQLKTWALALALALGNLAALSDWTQAQTQSRSRSPQTTVAYDRGYTDGYDDGYRTGTGNYEQNATRDHKRSPLYQDADRGYEARLGSLADYREGFRLGFELGYSGDALHLPSSGFTVQLVFPK